MCGRYILFHSKINYENALTNAGGLALNREISSFEISPDYNVPPSKAVWARTMTARTHGSNRSCGGLLARWAKNPTRAHPPNARAETLATNQLFAPLLRKWPCLAPCDGHYEWKTTPSGKQPYLVRMKSSEPFFVAGLYDIWHEGASDQLAAFTMISCLSEKAKQGFRSVIPRDSNEVIDFSHSPLRRSETFRKHS